MRRPDENLRRLAPVSLFRDDLQELVGCAAPQGAMEFRCDGFVYASLEELVSHEGAAALTNLVIQPVGDVDGAAAIAIHPRHVEVFSLSPASERPEKTAAFLRSRARGQQPRWWRVLYSALVWLVSILAAALVFRFGELPRIALALLAGFAAVAFSSLLTSAQRSLGESVIHLHYRGERRQVASKATIVVVALMSGLVGLLIGVMAR